MDSLGMWAPCRAKSRRLGTWPVKRNNVETMSEKYRRGQRSSTQCPQPSAERSGPFSACKQRRYCASELRGASGSGGRPRRFNSPHDFVAQRTLVDADHGVELGTTQGHSVIVCRVEEIGRGEDGLQTHVIPR